MSEQGKLCPEKYRYPTQLVAFKALAAMRSKGRSEKRIYRCRYCRGWHTTGKPLRMPVEGPWPGAPAGIA